MTDAIVRLIVKLAEMNITIFVENGKLKVDSDDPVLLDSMLPTIREHREALIAYLGARQESSTAGIPQAPLQHAWPLSSSQRRLWVLSRFTESNVAYNMPAAYVFSGELDATLLQNCFYSIVKRHEPLRTVFKEDEDGEVKQFIVDSDQSTFNIPYYDVSGEADKDERVRSLVQNEFTKPFDLEKGPLFRAALFQLEANKWIFSYVMHHIISDGWSMMNLIKELLLLYNAHGEDGLLRPLRIQYKDFATWQQQQLEKDTIHEQRNFWLQQLQEELPVLNFPADKPRPAVKSYHGAAITKQINDRLSNGLKAICFQQDATLFMGLLAMVNTLLYRYTGQEDIIIGSPIAGREHADLEEQIGLYVNTLPLRLQFSGDDGYHQVLQKVKRVTVAAYEHQSYPFDKLVDDLRLVPDRSRNPLFDVMVVLQNTADYKPVHEYTLNGLQVAAYQGGGRVAGKLDLLFDFVEMGAGIQVVIEYNTDIYDQASIERLAAHLEQLWSAIVEEPLMAVRKLNYLNAEEKHTLLHDFNDTAAGYSRNDTIIQLFEKQVHKTPGDTALVFSERAFTYKTLNEKANRLGDYLRATYNIQPNDLVLVCLERSEWMIIALLGVLKAGAAYVPVDPAYPAERIAYMVADSGCKVIIDDRELTAFLQVQHEYNSENVSCVNRADDLVYVIYTSGSTGRPKGCMLRHFGVVNRIEWMWNQFGFNASDIILQKTTFTFDVSVWEIFMPLCMGAKMVLCQQEDVNAPERILSLIRKEAVTCLHFVPGMMQAFISALFRNENIQQSLQSLRRVITSGEALPIGTVKSWYEQMDVPVHNLYGPTEASVDVTYYTTSRTDTKIYIGRPIWNTQLYILDADHQLQPVGVIGEICIGGDGLATGYLNKPELTASKFVPHPFSPSKTIYKTGDLGRWLPDGNIEFVGRIDDQVKIRGYRIEPGEIERALEMNEGIESATVLLRSNSEGEKHLVAYVVCNQLLQVPDMRSWLARSLPAYMIPAYFIQLPEMPLTPNGKIDKKRLPAIKGLDMRTGMEYVAPRNKLEQDVVTALEEVLQRQPVGMKDDYFVLGGDSIKSIRLVSKLKQKGYSVTIQQVLLHPLVEELVKQVTVATRVPDQSPVKGIIPLSPIQHAFFQNNNTSKHHYNQSLLLKSREMVSEEAARAALNRILAHHDGLRMVFRQEADHWIQENKGIDVACSFEVITAATEEIFIEHCERIQKSFQLDTGPLFKAALFRTGIEDRLLFVAHHLVIDAVSWRIVLEDFCNLYQQYVTKKPLTLPLKTDSFAYWQTKQLAYANSDALQSEQAFWTAIEQKQLAPLPVDFPGGTNYIKDIATASFGLNEQDTAKLLSQCYKAWHTDTRDILLTALGLALNDVFGLENILVGMEGHGRENVNADIDVSRTTGWFTTVYPVVLAINDKSDIIHQLIAVKEQLHRVPNKGLGYGVLRYLAGNNYQLAYPVIFNYLGDFGSGVHAGADELFEFCGDYHGSTVAAERQREALIDVSGMINNGRLHITIIYSTKQYSVATIGRLLAVCQNKLDGLIEKLSNSESNYLTPIDLTYNELSFEQVLELNHSRDLENVYPLSPLQEGLYYYWLSHPGSSAYFMQIGYRVKGKLDSDLLEKAYRELIARHSVLRTYFSGSLAAKPLQIVRRHAHSEFVYYTLSNDPGVSIEKYKEEDRLKGFDLHTGSQMRLTVLKEADDTYTFIWSHHHILLDGWCISILFREFFTIYHGLTNGGMPELPAVSPYANYIQWLSTLNKDNSLVYWRNYLSGFDTITGIPATANMNALPMDSHSLKIELDGTLRKGMAAVCAALTITENTFIQAVWAILLARYNNTTDVVFGSVVSGRNPAVAGIEEMIGLFSNTIPVRIRLDEQQTARQLLQAVHQRSVEAADHHYVQLAEVQAESEPGSGLFEHILVFQNFPAGDMIKKEGVKYEALSFLSCDVYEQTNYPLVLTIIPGDTFVIRFDYNNHVYHELQMNRLKDHLLVVIRQVINNCDTLLPDITCLGGEETRQLLYDFNDTAITYPAQTTLVDLFMQQVAKTPGNIAVVFEDRQLTYQQLHERSDRLAGYLKKELQLQADDLIGVMLDRSEQMVVAILGIMKAGAAYVPVDPEYPRARKKYIIQNAAVRALITQSDYLFDLDYYEGTVFALDIQFDGIADLPAPGAVIKPGDLAYVIYTSGSTGTPKGVMIEHEAIVNTINAQQAIFEAGEGARNLQFASPAFDASVSEIFVSLASGGQLYIVPERIRKDALLFKQYIRENNIEIATIPPAYLKLLNIEHIKCLRKLITAGEAALYDKAESFTAHGIYLNAYGPTETAICATVFKVPMGQRIGTPVIPIGTPIANTQVYIVNEHNHLMPVGIAGELCIGGNGLARGYLNNATLTAEKFVDNPFREGEKMYRTGDLARWMPDGNIEFIGRKDDQVKISGYRIEPGEIENALLANEAIEAAVVLSYTGVRSEKELVAFIVSKETFATADLRSYLSAALPVYMVPHHFVAVDAIPVNANGKINRKALIDLFSMDHSSGEGFVNPRNEIEHKLTDIWCDVLGKVKVSINDNFFNLGGQSLKAIRLVSQLYKEFAVKVELKDIFANPVLEEQGKLIQRLHKVAFAAIPNLPKQAHYPLSASQRRLWLLSQLDENSVAYNIPAVFTLQGILDKKALEYAFDQLLLRHEILRTVFRDDENGEVRQFVLEPGETGFGITWFNLCELADQEEKLQCLLQQEVHRPFDLSAGPLLRAVLYRIADDKWVFGYITHHIISDGWSMDIVIKELLQLYDARLNGKPDPLQPLAIQYKDFAGWQHKQLDQSGLADHKKYWLQRFEGELPVLELPGYATRPPVKTFSGGKIVKTIDPLVYTALSELCQQHDCTLFMGLLASVYVLLHRYSHQQDIIIGSPVSGREHPDLEAQIGFYVNTLALRLNSHTGSTYRELLSNVKQVTLEAYEHQAYPFDELVGALPIQRDMSRNPLFDVMVAMQITGQDAVLKNYKPRDLIIGGYAGGDKQSVAFDLAFNFAVIENRLQLCLEYNSDIYDQQLASQMAGHVAQLLHAAVHHPDQPVHNLNFLRPEEQLQLLQDFNNTSENWPSKETLVDLFQKQVAARPEAVAVVYNERQLTYRTLDERSDQLADYLKKRYRVRAGGFAGIMMERSDVAVVAILAILKCGAAYVPIDPAYPEARITYLLKDTGLNVLFVENDRVVPGSYAGDIVDMEQFNCAENDMHERPDVTIGYDDLAYVIYTSGSTGDPKGVMIEHRAIVNTIRSQQQIFGVSAGDRNLQFASLSFDASVSEIFVSLVSGGALYIIPEEDKKDPVSLASYLNKNRIDIATIPPAYLKLLEIEQIRTLKRLVTAGEAAIRDKAILFSETGIYFNAYGPTESSICASIFHLTHAASVNSMQVPVGKPIHNTYLYVLDEQHALTPVGVTGEIYIGGAGLARGYLNNLLLTNEKFVANPFRPGERMYRTGDTGRWLPDGNLEFTGRKDHQVKIRGYRIELEEIQSVLQRYADIELAAVAVHRDPLNEACLVAYLVGKKAIDIAGVRAFLSSQLPAYMLPLHYLQLPEMPLTASGKINRKALPVPDTTEAIGETACIAPRNETEKKLIAIWQQLLGVGNIGIKHNFFDCGGHSLKATRLLGQINKEFEVRVHLKELFINPVLEDQARLIQEAQRRTFLALPTAASQSGYVLSSAQRRLYILSRFKGGNTAYNMPGVYVFEGILRIDALQLAFKSLIDRHEILRTVFREDEEGEVKQYIINVEEHAFALGYTDLRLQPETVDTLLYQRASQAFDLAAAPLLRADIYQLSNSKWVFGYVMHHIISDGWSMRILIEELLLLYNAFVKGEAKALAPLRIQYKDYAVWQQQQLHSENLQNERTYWLNQFAGELPVLELAVDKVRPAIKTYNGGVVMHQFSRKLTDELQGLCRREKATLFMGLLSAVKVLLYRYAGQEDIITGTLVAGRDHADLDNQIGFYVNTLALRASVSGDIPFLQLLSEIREMTLNAYAHQSYPFDELVDALSLQRDTSRHPLFDVMVVLQNNHLSNHNAGLNGLQVSGYRDEQQRSGKFDILFVFEDTATGIQLHAEYNRDIFYSSTIERMVSHLAQLLTAIVDEPTLPVKNISYISTTEHALLLNRFNDTATPYPQDKTVVDLFKEQASKTPDRIAIEDENVQLTYAGLDEASDKLADHLIQHYNIQLEDCIAIQLDRSVQLLIAILGILKSGAAYVPIDTDLPRVRKEFIVKDTAARLLITQGDYVLDADFYEGAVFAIDIQLTGLENKQHYKCRDVLPNNLAYIMYTSGTMGAPKGVMIEHRSIVRLVKPCNYAPLTGDEVLLSTGAVSFDATTFEYWAMLLNGGKLVMCRREALLDGVQLGTVIKKHAVNTMWFTAGWFNELADRHGEVFEGLTTILAGGDKLSAVHINAIKERYPAVKIINGYGPTENTTFSLCYEITTVTDNIPLGRPVNNSTAYILDNDQALCGVGVAGEICVGGAGLARGYVNNPQLTAEKFVANPFIPGERMYRTGDTGRWLPDGNIEFLGRKDNQVKIRGYRVEPGEVETALQHVPGIESAVVLAKAGKDGQKKLIAYFVGNETLTASALKSSLGNVLPAYMLPDSFVQLAALPLTTNGKIDKNNLPEPDGLELDTGMLYVAPRNETEERLATIWQEVLSKERIGMKDGFFEIGGQSIAAMRLISRIRKDFEVEYSIDSFYKYPTIEAVAVEIEKIKWASGSLSNTNNIIDAEIFSI